MRLHSDAKEGVEVTNRKNGGGATLSTNSLTYAPPQISQIPHEDSRQLQSFS